MRRKQASLTSPPIHEARRLPAREAAGRCMYLRVTRDINRIDDAGGAFLDRMAPREPCSADPKNSDGSGAPGRPRYCS